VAQNEILSVKEVAELLGCSPSHVRRLLNGTVPDVPRIPHMRAGRVRLIRRVAVLAWLETLKQVTAAAAKGPLASQRARTRKAVG
jgi:excisionase family DNA binding protein